MDLIDEIVNWQLEQQNGSRTAWYHTAHFYGFRHADLSDEGTEAFPMGAGDASSWPVPLGRHDLDNYLTSRGDEIDTFVHEVREAEAREVSRAKERARREESTLSRTKRLLFNR